MENVKSMRISFLQTIDKNIRPLSNSLLKTVNSKKEVSMNDISISRRDMHSIPIKQTHEAIREMSPSINYKTNRNIISCLKAAHATWSQYMSIPNKTGQIASKYLKKMKIIDEKFQEQISQLSIQGLGSLDKLREIKKVFEETIQHLQRKAKKYLEHEAEMRMISVKKQEILQSSENQEDEIKEEMLELVQKFKKYAVDIQQDLRKDSDVIDDINKKQDKQLDSLKNKSDQIKVIVKDQKLGFIQLLVMGIIAIALWIFGLFVILIL